MGSQIFLIILEDMPINANPIAGQAMGHGGYLLDQALEDGLIGLSVMGIIPPATLQRSSLRN